MKKAWKICAIITFVVYCMAVLHIVLLSRLYMLRYGWGKNSILQYLSYNANFVPFRTIGGYITALRSGSMNRGIPIKNLLGNALMFLPLGIYLPLLWEKMRSFRATFLTTLGVLLVIELLQMVTRLGSFDIDDLILNLLGAAVGYGVYVIWGKFWDRRTQWKKTGQQKKIKQ